MDIILILVRQILQMFVLAGIGYLLFRSRKITLESSKALGNILIYAALPAVIINGFRVERTTEHLLGMLYSGVAAAVLLVALLGRLKGWQEQEQRATFPSMVAAVPRRSPAVAASPTPRSWPRMRNAIRSPWRRCGTRSRRSKTP